MTNLADLNRAAVFAYETEMRATLASPGRLKEVYGAAFKAQQNQERLATVCQTVSTLLDADGAEINLITDTEQICVAAADGHTRVTPVHDGYCRFVVAASAPFNVESAENHALVCTARTTVEGGLRAYLGMPLILNNQSVGALCAYNTTDRAWSAAQVSLLTSMAALVVDTLYWD